ncbi:E3 ubiquitin-protein ligase TRIM39-like isoform X2 [Labeo rohita]|uniref:E3 ubiquitin-protein ligase TRIM39-like isoform X2 n=1 Tax=Labeo rohita TaxID=84645 RepID=UPI0021E30076|nr:E3 ubiquitin-protein ligase TRIM39-like isoform X2 [Labeo rohita]
MASSSDPLNEELQCSICLDVFTDPVTTPCGHNFCRTCLNKCWTNTQTCCCPLCKEKFSNHLDLEINTTLRKLVQHFKKVDQEKSEVFCDFCDERKQKAMKSCLTCQSSYCETHLEPHHRVPRLKKHKLINAVKNLEDYICQKHERPLELFCRDDQTCVCLSCTEGDHRNHNTVPIEEESQQKKLHKHEQNMLQNRVKKQINLIKELQQEITDLKRNTEEEKSGSVELFTDLIRPIERRQSELLKMMEEQQKAAEKQAEDLIKELQQEITDLKRRNTELEQLSHTDDHLHLLQVYSSLYSLSHTKNWIEISTDSDVDVFTLKRALTLLKEQLNEKLSQTGLKWAQKFAVDATLDPDTANPYLILSNDGKQVSEGDIKQDIPENPKRFDVGLCVLAMEGFSSGRFYYEVQVKGKTEWDLGVARESINRKGLFRLNPVNGFWTVGLRNDNQYIACENPSVSLSLKVKPEKVGVFVDYEEGLVSFYDVGSRSHIYSFTGQTFTDKLYSYFSPGHNDEGKNSNPLIITPVS